MGSLGLVWIRLFFIYAVVTSPCAEQIASFGYIQSGWLAGQTVWSMLYASSALATLFCLTVILCRHNKKYPVVTIFRQTLLVGFGLLAITTRSLVVEDPNPLMVLCELSSEAFHPQCSHGRIGIV